MREHGIDNVRGGSYSRLELHEDLRTIEKELLGAVNVWFRCGRDSHMIRDCYAKQDVNGNLDVDYDSNDNYGNNRKRARETVQYVSSDDSDNSDDSSDDDSDESEDDVVWLSTMWQNGSFRRDVLCSNGHSRSVLEKGLPLTWTWCHMNGLTLSSEGDVCWLTDWLIDRLIVEAYDVI